MTATVSITVIRQHFYNFYASITFLAFISTIISKHYKFNLRVKHILFYVKEVFLSVGAFMIIIGLDYHFEETSLLIMKKFLSYFEKNWLNHFLDISKNSRVRLPPSPIP